MNPNIDAARVEEVRQQMCSALEQTADGNTREALAAGLQLLETLTEASPADRSLKPAGSMVYTFEDEDYEPHGRQIDLRIDYDWSDYDPADEPFGSWGPTIAEVNVLAIRYLDEDGNNVPVSVHYAELAWDVVNKHHEQMLEACTEHGYQHGVGKTPATYSGQHSASALASTGNANFVARLAPSEPTRATQQNRRHLG